MLKRSRLPAAMTISAAFWLAAGCTPPPPPPVPPTASGPKSVPNGPSTDSSPKGTDMADTAPVEEGIVAAIKQNPELFPKGVKLETVTVQGGVAALDFSTEFNKLGSMGDTTESRTHKRLRAALARFPEIEKMTVTVHGKPYDSQMTDWTTPFPVRLSDEEKEASANSGGAR